MKIMRKILVTLMTLITASYVQATVVETDQFIYTNKVTYSNRVVIGNNVLYTNGAGGLIINDQFTVDTNGVLYIGGMPVSPTVVSNWNNTATWAGGNSNVLSTAGFTLTTNIVFSNASSTNYTIPLLMNGCSLIGGLIYFANTNNLTNTTGNIVYYKTITARFYKSSSYAPFYRGPEYDFDLYCITNIASTAIGATNILVTDTSNFATNDMVLITGTDAANTNEYAILSAIPLVSGGTNLIFESALTNSHAADTAVMKIKEFGAVQLYDVGGSTNIFVKFSATNAITATLEMKLEYKK